MEPEDVDAVLERSVPADLGTTYTEASVDREVLARLRRLQGEVDPDIVAELTRMFLKDARSRLEALEEALQKGDAPAVERAAHALKGGSGSMGARGMSGLCAQLEDLGASGDLSRALYCSDGSGRSWGASSGRWRQRSQATGNTGFR